MIPTHGPAPYLRQAIDSAGGASEILVVEDGTEEVDDAAVSPARLLRVPHGGRSRARNAGVEAARTTAIAFLDNDDLSLPGRVERQWTALEAAPQSALAFGAASVVDGALHPLEHWRRVLEPRFARLVAEGGTFETLLASRCPIYTSATMVRREAFLESGGFDPAFDAYEDLDLYLRLARRAPLTPVPGEPVTLYRLHGENTPSDRLYEGMLGVVDKHLPQATGRARRLLLERRLESLWGLGRWAEARREALRALRAEPRLLGHGRWVRRAAATLVPDRLLAARRP